MRRGALLLGTALAAVANLSGPVDAGPDRLIPACQAAVDVHAHAVTLRFSEPVQHDYEVALRFAFDNDGGTHEGEARCVFHRPPSLAVPPSLIDLDIAGSVTPARFLASHQAVWRFFSGELEAAPDARSGDTAPPRTDEPRKRHAALDRM